MFKLIITALAPAALAAPIPVQASPAEPGPEIHQMRNIFPHNFEPVFATPETSLPDAIEDDNFIDFPSPEEYGDSKNMFSLPLSLESRVEFDQLSWKAYC